MNTAAVWLVSRRAFANVELGVLMRLTAAAFGVPAPRARERTTEERLAAYARFTVEQAERALHDGRDMAALHQALYRRTRALGDLLRRCFRLRTYEGRFTMLVALYRNIGIDLVGQLPGELRMTRCFFSNAYSPSVCRLISALDEGMFAGLCQGGTLEFSERITEGCALCRARFE